MKQLQKQRECSESLGWIWINGKILKSSKRCLGIDLEFLLGVGLFETIKVEDKKVYFLKEHLERLNSNLKDLGLSPKYKVNIEDCLSILKKNKADEGILRIFQSRNTSLIFFKKGLPYKGLLYKKGIKVKISKYKQNENGLIERYKSMSFLQRYIERERANKEGFFEVLFLNHKNKIAEAANSNIFFCKKETLITPSLDCGIVSGIIRNLVINIAKKENIKVVEGEIELSSLREFDCAFLTSSLMELQLISWIEDIFKSENSKLFDFLYNKFKNERERHAIQYL